MALGAVLAAGLALRVVYWYGFVTVDSHTYADAAESVVRGLPVFDPDLAGPLYYTQYLRLTLVLPAAAAFAVFGPGEVQSIIFPLACSLSTGVLAYLLAMRVSGARTAGVVAALITVVFPEGVINSTEGLPDSVLAFFSTLTILLFWEGTDASERPWKARAGLFAAAGAAWALAFYSRQTAVGLALPLAGLVLYRRRFDPAMLAGVPAALVVACGASVLLVSLGGAPFEDIRTVITEGRASQAGSLGYTDFDLTYLDTFTSDGKFIPLTALALVGAGLIAASWRRTSRRERSQCVALAIVIAGLFAYFEFLMRLPSLYSWIKEPRYVLTLVPLLAVVAGVGLARWTETVTRRAQPAAFAYTGLALAFMAAFNVASVDADHEYWQSHRVDQLAREVAAAVESRPEPVVYTWNDDLSRYMSIHVGLGGTTVFERHRGEGYVQNRLDGDDRSRVAPGSLVVISPGQDHWSKPTAHAAHWQLLWSDGEDTAIWSVPQAPPPVAMAPVRAQLAPGIAVSSFGVSERQVFPQHHVLVSLAIENGGAGRLPLSLGLRCGGPVTLLRQLEAGPGSETVTTDVAIDVPGSATTTRTCEFVAATEGGPWAPLGVIEVGAIVRLEPEEGLSYDAETERERGSGWYRRDSAAISSGVAIAIEPRRPLNLAVPEVEGDVWVDIGAWDYGDGVNTVEVAVNGVTGKVTWGGGGSPGPVHRVVALPAVPRGARLSLAVVAAGQGALSIDAIVMTTVAPPAP